MKRAPRKKRAEVALRLVLADIVACLGLASGQCVWALDSALDVSQYAHTAWKVRDGGVMT